MTSGIPAGERRLLWSVLIVLAVFTLLEGLVLARLGARIDALENLAETAGESPLEDASEGLAAARDGRHNTMERIAEFSVENDLDPDTAAALRQLVEASEARLQGLPARVEDGEITEEQRFELLAAELGRRHEEIEQLLGPALARELRERLPGVAPAPADP